MKTHLLTAALLAAIAAPTTLTAEEKPQYRSSKEIIDSAPASAWRTPAPENLLYMEFGEGRLAIIELAPQFAPQHVENIRRLARGGFWDGTSIYRSQDNFVVQFGDAHAEDAAKAKPLPQDVAQKLPAEFKRSTQGLAFTPMPDRDGWAAEVGFVDGFHAARNQADGEAWMTHCYGLLGAGRGNAPDSSIGAELYVVTGQSPRALDGNITSVGRVLRGMEFLSVLPRGPEPLGMYTDPAMHTPIKRIRLGSEIPASERLQLEVMRTDAPEFAKAVEARRNRRDAWYVHPAGHIDICNISVPVREKASPARQSHQ
ncbi:peptidylprolyl isomerase [Lysobacteraceae bacterium NML07-0707]|nr:peptidylprolyl isomerase [Xanthomonadaceae bacterium NML07-0707]